jgi:hypothetical protein
MTSLEEIMALDDAKHLEEIEALADAIAARIQMAVVRRIPQALVEVFYDGKQSVQQLFGTSGPNYVALWVTRQVNVLELTFEMNGQIVTTFRFEGHE